MNQNLNLVQPDGAGLQARLVDAVRRNGIAVCQHPGSDVIHQVVRDGRFWRVTTRCLAGVLREARYSHIDSVALALAGSELLDETVKEAVNQ